MSIFLSRVGVLWMRVLSCLPLTLIRWGGACLGRLLYLAVPSRRRVADVNLSRFEHVNELEGSERSEPQRRRLRIETFKSFAQAWLDRSWLWHAPPRVLQERLRLSGDSAGLALLNSRAPLIIFAPHFVGLDAGWTALTSQLPERGWVTIYTDQSNKVVDAWILRGRSRFSTMSLYGRAAGVKPIVAALKSGGALYLLPDMDFGAEGAEFVPLFGEVAATVSSLSRFAKLGKARVVSVSSRLTPSGYDIEVSAPWLNFPTDDLNADAARMNLELERLIQKNPSQYWWLHKRYKTRPPGSPGLYR